MNPVFTNYLKKLLILTFITGAFLAMAYAFLPYPISPVMPFLLAFFLGVSVLSFYLLLKKAGSNPGKFITGFLAHTVIRMAVYLVVILSYAFIYRQDAVNFIIGFFIYYMIFTFFEVSQFLKLTRKKDINHQ